MRTTMGRAVRKITLAAGLGLVAATCGGIAEPALADASDRKITPRILYRSVVSHGVNQEATGQPLPDPATILMLGSSLVAMGIFVRRLWRR